MKMFERANTFLLVLILAVLGIGVFLRQTHAAHRDQRIGRYTSFVHGDSIYVLDTASGEMHSVAASKGELVIAHINPIKGVIEGNQAVVKVKTDPK